MRILIQPYYFWNGHYKQYTNSLHNNKTICVASSFADRLHEKPSNMPYVNYLANYFFALIASILFWIRIKDLHSGMRAYKKKIINNLPYSKKSVSLPVELILWPIRLNYRVTFVDIPYKERIGQSKLEPLKAAYWTVIRILRARFLIIK